MFKVPMQVRNYRQKSEDLRRLNCYSDQTYSCFSNDTLAKFVEVNEEFSDTDSIFDNGGLDSLLNIIFVTKSIGLTLIVALMAVS